MGWSVVITVSGGIPVTETANGMGIPVEINANGYGAAVTIVPSGGLGVVGTGAASAGSGSMDFSIATGDNTGLLALLEDI